MRLAVIACIAASAGFPMWAAQVPQDAAQIGPAVGAAAPDFSLVDQFGQKRTLESLMGPNGLVLVFFRSADW